MEGNNQSKTENYINYLLERKRTDKGLSARFRRADNPDTEYQSWGALAAFKVDLEKDRERLPYALIGAAVCRSDISSDGVYGIGQALAGTYEGARGENREKPGSARMRRLLSCSTTREVCQVLRPILQLVNGKTSKPLSHARLLQDLLNFESPAGDRIKRRWAMEFYAGVDEEKPE